MACSVPHTPGSAFPEDKKQMTSPSGPSAAGQAVAGDDADSASGATAAGASGATEPGHNGQVVNPAEAMPSAAAMPAERGYDAGPAWARFLPPLLALAFTLWGITRPSFWRDEAATTAPAGPPSGHRIPHPANLSPLPRP